MRKIVNCPTCSKSAMNYGQPLGIQCCHCGHGCAKLDLGVQAQIPKGKIKTQPIGKFDLDVVKVFVEPGKQINLF